jgi:hypothetical protein
MFSDITLNTVRLAIRPLRPDDAEQLHSVVSQEEVVRFLPEDVMTLDDVREIIAWLTDCYRQNTPEP